MVVGHDLPFVLQPGHGGQGVTGDIAGQVQILRERRENRRPEMNRGGRVGQWMLVSEEAVKFRAESVYRRVE